MHVVLVIDEEGDITPLATAPSREDAERFAAEHILRERPLAGIDLQTLLDAELYGSVIDEWNTNRFLSAHPVRYALLDLEDVPAA